MRYLGRGYRSSIVDDVKFTPYVLWTTIVEEDDFYDDFLPKSSRLQDIIDDKKEEYPQISALAMDVFYSLYRYYPRLNDKNEIDAEFLLNYGAVKTFMDTTKYKEIRSMTKHDELTSLMGAELFIEQAFETITSLKDQHSEALAAYTEAAEKLKEALKDEDANPYDSEEAKKALEEAREELEDLYKDKQKREVQENAQDLFGDLQEISEVMGNWGLGNDGTYQKMSYQEKMGMINKLKNSEKLKRISMLAGKLKEIFMQGERAKTKKAHSSIDDIVQGNTVSRLLPSELARYGLPGARKAFYKDYIQKKLLQHEYAGKRKKGKGPIVAMVDCSGSMSGSSEIYAKAVCMTLLDMSRRQKRNFLVVHFDSGTSPENLHVNRFSKKNPYNVKEVVDLAEYFGGGGTEFEPPLQRARNEINEEPEFTKADIVMITDGCAPVGDGFLEDFNKWRKKKTISLFSILIDSGWSNTETLELFSDRVTSIEDLSGEQGFDVAKALVNHLV